MNRNYFSLTIKLDDFSIYRYLASIIKTPKITSTTSTKFKEIYNFFEINQFITLTIKGIEALKGSLIMIIKSV